MTKFIDKCLKINEKKLDVDQVDQIIKGIVSTEEKYYWIIESDNIISGILKNGEFENKFAYQNISTYFQSCMKQLLNKCLKKKNAKLRYDEEFLFLLEKFWNNVLAFVDKDSSNKNINPTKFIRFLLTSLTDLTMLTRFSDPSEKANLLNQRLVGLYNVLPTVPLDSLLHCKTLIYQKYRQSPEEYISLYQYILKYELKTSCDAMEYMKLILLAKLAFILANAKTPKLKAICQTFSKHLVVSSKFADWAAGNTSWSISKGMSLKSVINVLDTLEIYQILYPKKAEKDALSKNTTSKNCNESTEMVSRSSQTDTNNKKLKKKKLNDCKKPTQKLEDFPSTLSQSIKSNSPLQQSSKQKILPASQEVEVCDKKSHMPQKLKKKKVGKVALHDGWNVKPIEAGLEKTKVVSEFSQKNEKTVKKSKKLKNTTLKGQKQDVNLNAKPIELQELLKPDYQKEKILKLANPPTITPQSVNNVERQKKLKRKKKVKKNEPDKSSGLILSSKDVQKQIHSQFNGVLKFNEDSKKRKRGKINLDTEAYQTTSSKKDTHKDNQEQSFKKQKISVKQNKKQKVDENGANATCNQLNVQKKKKHKDKPAVKDLKLVDSNCLQESKLESPDTSSKKKRKINVEHNIINETSKKMKNNSKLDNSKTKSGKISKFNEKKMQKKEKRIKSKEIQGILSSLQKKNVTLKNQSSDSDKEIATPDESLALKNKPKVVETTDSCPLKKRSEIITQSVTETSKSDIDSDSGLEVELEKIVSPTGQTEVDVDSESDIDEASGSDGDIIPCDEDNSMFTSEETSAYNQYLRDENLKEEVHTILLQEEYLASKCLPIKEDNDKAKTNKDIEANIDLKESERECSTQEMNEQLDGNESEADSNDSSTNKLKNTKIDDVENISSSSKFLEQDLESTSEPLNKRDEHLDQPTDSNDEITFLSETKNSSGSEEKEVSNEKEESVDSFKDEVLSGSVRKRLKDSHEKETFNISDSEELHLDGLFEENLSIPEQESCLDIDVMASENAASKREMEDILNSSFVVSETEKSVETTSDDIVQESSQDDFLSVEVVKCSQSDTLSQASCKDSENDDVVIYEEDDLTNRSTNLSSFSPRSKRRSRSSFNSPSKDSKETTNKEESSSSKKNECFSSSTDDKDDDDDVVLILDDSDQEDLNPSHSGEGLEQECQDKDISKEVKNKSFVEEKKGQENAEGSPSSKLTGTGLKLSTVSSDSLEIEKDNTSEEVNEVFIFKGGKMDSPKVDQRTTPDNNKSYKKVLNFDESDDESLTLQIEEVEELCPSAKSGSGKVIDDDSDGEKGKHENQISETEVTHTEVEDSSSNTPSSIKTRSNALNIQRTKENIVNNEQLEEGSEVEVLSVSQTTEKTTPKMQSPRTDSNLEEKKIVSDRILKSPTQIAMYMSPNRRSHGRKGSLENSATKIKEIANLTPLKVASAALSNEVVISPNVSDEENTPHDPNDNSEDETVIPYSKNNKVLALSLHLEEEQVLDVNDKDDDILLTESHVGSSCKKPLERSPKKSSENKRLSSQSSQTPKVSTQSPENTKNRKLSTGEESSLENNLKTPPASSCNGIDNSLCKPDHSGDLRKSSRLKSPSVSPQISKKNSSSSPKKVETSLGDSNDLDSENSSSKSDDANPSKILSTTSEASKEASISPSPTNVGGDDDAEASKEAAISPSPTNVGGDDDAEDRDKVPSPRYSLRRRGIAADPDHIGALNSPRQASVSKNENNSECASPSHPRTRRQTLGTSGSATPTRKSQKKVNVSTPVRRSRRISGMSEDFNCL